MASDGPTGSLLWGDSATWQGEERPWVGGRFRLGERLGSGGGGEVFTGVDMDSGQAVALKRLFRPDHARVQREIGALQRLDLPGVARLRDTVQEDHALWLVMDRIDGSPFPGPVPPGGSTERWQATRPVLLRLLEALEAVHELGVVHRDLKPSNVLVDDDGQPWILDFGLARGRDLGSTITVKGQVLGTPRYISPEVLSGGEVDGRADLYSLGVMLFELLAERPPHRAEQVEALVAARLGEAAPGLATFCPSLPRAVTELIDGLLQRRPERRPASAAAVLARLTGRAVERLPWLGTRAPIETLLAAARSGRSAAVAGPPGSGRTRVLAEVAAGLQAEGRAVARVAVGERPFESLAAVLEVPDAGDVPALVGQRLHALAADTVLLVDDAERVDRWSGKALEAVAEDHVVLWGRAGAQGEVVLEPLPEEALRGLFAGPELLLHLPTDGARVLRARTGGVPALVDATVRSWLRQGRAGWHDGRLRISREWLDRLALGRTAPPSTRMELEPAQLELLRWIRAGGRGLGLEELAAAIGRPRWEVELELGALSDLGAVSLGPDGLLELMVTPLEDRSWHAARRQEACRRLAEVSSDPIRRLALLVEAGEAAQVPTAAVSVADMLWRRGQVSRALAQLVESIDGVGLTSQDPRAPWVARLAVHQRTRAGLEQSLRLLQGSEPAWICALVATVLAVQRGDEGAADMLDALGPLPIQDLEDLRLDERVRAARLRGLQDERAVIEAQAPAAAPAWASRWRARLAYRERDFSTAARLHEEAARAWQALGPRLDDLLYAASCRMEAGDLDGAAALVEAEALGLAEDERLVAYETRARLYLRLCRIRAGAAAVPDREWVEAVAVAGTRWMLGIVAVNEAGVAWHAGRAQVGRELARRAAEAARDSKDPATEVYAQAIGRALGDEKGPPTGAIIACALDCGVPGITLDVVGLLGEDPLSDRVVDAVQRAAEALPRDTWTVRHGIFAVSDVLRRVGPAAG